MLTVTLNNPNKAPGKQLGVFGLGVMVNGEPRQLTVAEEKGYYAATGKGVTGLNGTSGFTVEGTPEFSVPQAVTETPFGVNEPTPVVPFIPKEAPKEESEVTT